MNSLQKLKVNSSCCCCCWTVLVQINSEPSCHQRPALVTTCDHDLIVMSCLPKMAETLSPRVLLWVTWTIPKLL